MIALNLNVLKFNKFLVRKTGEGSGQSRGELENRDVCVQKYENSSSHLHTIFHITTHYKNS